MSLHQLLSRLCWDPDTTVCSLITLRINMQAPLSPEHVGCGVYSTALVDIALVHINCVLDKFMEAWERGPEPAVPSHQPSEFLTLTMQSGAVALDVVERVMLERASDDEEVSRRVEAITDCLGAQARPVHT